MCGGLNGELKSPLVLVPGVYDTVHGRMALEDVNEPLVGVICVLWYSLHVVLNALQDMGQVVRDTQRRGQCGH